MWTSLCFRLNLETITSGSSVKILDFIYDESGKPFALKYTNGTASPVTYYYILNLQGDVLGLINASGTLVARYTYNAWGELTYSSGSMAEINPLRYRGYYYDTETGFYYLQSRYYDPVTHRFINADTAEYSAMAAYSLNDTNLFSYCGNNPVSRADDGGEFWHIVVGAVVGAVVGIVSQVVTSKLAGETVTLEEIVIAGSFGAIEGALIATCPVAAPGISAAVSATESVVQDVTENRIENGDNTVVDIFSNATVSAGFGALTNSIGINGNSALYNKAGAAIKDAYISTVRPTVQKLARNAVGAGAKEFGKSLAGDTGAGVVFGLIEKGYQEIVKYFVK